MKLKNGVLSYDLSNISICSEINKEKERRFSGDFIFMD